LGREEKEDEDRNTLKLLNQSCLIAGVGETEGKECADGGSNGRERRIKMAGFGF